jgi:hypothetical protein
MGPAYRLFNESIRQMMLNSCLISARAPGQKRARTLGGEHESAGRTCHTGAKPSPATTVNREPGGTAFRIGRSLRQATTRRETGHFGNP